jgi:SAM-dependent methyltransferase
VEHLLRATAQAEARHFWFRGFRAFVTPLLRHATAGRSNPRLLDCGCGTGANLALLDRFGRAAGFDLSEAGLRMGRAAPFSDQTFDVVTSFDVIYSLENGDERAALTEMYRLLKPGGFAIINVAAMDALRGDHSVLSHEVRRYSRGQLRDRLTTAGFAIVRLTYTNLSLLAPLAVARTLQRRRGLRTETAAQHEIAVPPAPINALLTGILLLESAWIRRFDAPAGSSLLCLAQRPMKGLARKPDEARI